MRLPLATKAGSGRSTPLNPERLVNLYAEVAPENARSRVVVHGTPGNTVFSVLSGDIPRGMHFVSSLSRLFVVVGLTLYEVSSSGTKTNRGTIGGSGRVGIDDNGSQMAIMTVGISYVFTFATNTLSIITDSDFPDSRTVSFKGGYFVSPNARSGSRGQIVASSLYDGTDYDALDFATAEYKSDNLVREFVDHDQLILFGTNTIEYWFQVVADFPFSPQQGAVVEKGLGARWSVAKLDNSVIFLDNDGVVRRLNGNTPVRISTHDVEYAISRGPWRTDDDNSIEGAFAFSYVDEGHEHYALTVPGTCTKVYDAATGLWHDRESRGLNVWRYGFYVNAFGKHIVADSFLGTLYEQSLDVYEESAVPITSRMTFPQLNQDGRRIIVHEFQVDMEVGSRPMGQRDTTGSFSEDFEDDLSEYGLITLPTVPASPGSLSDFDIDQDTYGGALTISKGATATHPTLGKLLPLPGGLQKLTAKFKLVTAGTEDNGIIALRDADLAQVVSFGISRDSQFDAQQRPNLSFVDQSGNPGNPVGSGQVTVGTWYEVVIDYNNITSVFDCTIKNLTTGATFGTASVTVSQRTEVAYITFENDNIGGLAGVGRFDDVVIVTSGDFVVDDIPGEDPQVMLDVSGDAVTYDQIQLWRSMGKKGEYNTRVIWHCLGQHDYFTPEITISDPVKRAIFTAYADVEACD